MRKTMDAYDDPNNELNGPKYHTGKTCIEPGCENPAGTAWSPHWCQPCNAKRMQTITEHLNEIEASFARR